VRFKEFKGVDILFGLLWYSDLALSTDMGDIIFSLIIQGCWLQHK